MLSVCDKLKSVSKYKIDLKQGTQGAGRIRWQEPLGSPVSPSEALLGIKVKGIKRLSNRKKDLRSVVLF